MLPFHPGATVDFVLDLASHERTRLAAVLEAVGGSYDPVELLAGEQEALRLLYSGLDDEQLATLELLQDAGLIG